MKPALPDRRDATLRRDQTAERVTGSPATFRRGWKEMVEAMGLEPTILLRATQALYQTELRPQGRQRYQRRSAPRMPPQTEHMFA
jgi:hypothetical protein